MRKTLRCDFSPSGQARLVNFLIAFPSFHISLEMITKASLSALCLQKIYQDGGFVKYNAKGEIMSDRVEREWAESQLRAERNKNLRLGISEHLDVTLARVQALHTQSRVQTKQKEHDELMSALRGQYEVEVRGQVHFKIICF